MKTATEANKTAPKYNGEEHPCNLGRILGGLDIKRFELMLLLLRDYFERGESDELLEWGRHFTEKEEENP